MKSDIVSEAQRPAALSAADQQAWRRQWTRLAVLAVGLLVGFAKPLVTWVNFAWGSELFSYVLLVPAISAYLIWSKPPKPTGKRCFLRPWAGLPLLVGLLALGAYWGGWLLAGKPAVADYLALMMFALVCFLWSGSLLFLEAGVLRQASFPLGFLIFVLPFPEWLQAGITAFLQYGSTYVTHGLLRLSGLSFARHGLSFDVPGGLTLNVAPQCSGIHSTLVLFITSLLAAHMFLRSPRSRVLLTLVVLPLALLRNGLRIFTVIQLCVQIGPHMIDHYIHRKGGPFFFVLSLIPLVALLFWLRKSELKAGQGRFEAAPAAGKVEQSLS